MCHHLELLWTLSRVWNALNGTVIAAEFIHPQLNEKCIHLFIPLLELFRCWRWLWKKIVCSCVTWIMWLQTLKLSFLSFLRSHVSCEVLAGLGAECCSTKKKKPKKLKVLLEALINPNHGKWMTHKGVASCCLCGYSNLWNVKLALPSYMKHFPSLLVARLPCSAKKRALFVKSNRWPPMSVCYMTAWAYSNLLTTLILSLSHLCFWSALTTTSSFSSFLFWLAAFQNGTMLIAGVILAPVQHTARLWIASPCHIWLSLLGWSRIITRHCRVVDLAFV